MKISVLTPDVSHNCLGRAYMLARILQRRFDVEIIGPMFGEGVWAPLADAREVPLKTLRVRGSWTNAKAVALRDQLEGDVLYASKPRFPSYGLGLIEKLARRSSVVLDIDDWEGGFVRAARSERMERRPLRALLSDAVYNTTIALAEGLPRLADELTVSNTFLQKRFGGVLIWHGRDTEAFRPNRFSRSAVRAAHGIPDQEKVVMFLGSPGPHKGVEDLMEAVRRIPDPSVSLALVGIPDGTGYGARLRAEGLSLLGPRFRGMGFLPFDKVPELLTLADVVVIPQRRTKRRRARCLRRCLMPWRWASRSSRPQWPTFPTCSATAAKSSSRDPSKTCLRRSRVSSSTPGLRRNSDVGRGSAAFGSSAGTP